ncbi:MAG: glycosyltransferase family 4 protein [Bacteroidales bacterium]|nr:glycosyltransferase family 4 protein [Bacteroidales bacterium]
MKFKILHIIPSLQKGGAERLVLDICNELHSRAEIEVCLIIFRNINEYKSLTDNIIFKIIPSRVIPSLSGKATIEIDNLLSFINEFKPNVIHSHLFEAEIVSRWQILDGVKYITHCHDNMHQLQRFKLPDLFSKKRITELYEREKLLNRYKKCKNNFVAISSHTKKYFNSILPIELAKNIVLLHNAIDCRKFKIENRSYNELILINIGSFVAKKNQIFFIDIIKSLQKKNIYCKIILLGNGVLYNAVKLSVDMNGFSEIFTMPGNVSEVSNWLSNASIYVHSATYEPFGLVLLEAMAAGLPVITLNGGGNVDLIENGKNGFIIDEQNPELFADKIIEIWENKTLYNQISSNAQEFAQRFDIKEYVDKLIKLYKV